MWFRSTFHNNCDIDRISQPFQHITWIINSKSRKFNWLKEQLIDHSLPGHHEFHFTEHAGHGKELAQKASEHTDLLISAGGDGTFNEVVNGIKSSNNNPALTIFPIGTGNDLSRNFQLKPDLFLLQKALEDPSIVAIDIGEAIFSENNEKRYFANILDVGMGAEVVKKMNSGSKILGPGISYLWNITKTLVSYRPQEIKISVGDGISHSAKTMSFVIANGAWFGNDIKIAPDALPNDGIFNFTHLQDFSFWEYLINLPKAKKGKHIIHPKVNYGISNSFKISGNSEVEADGEWFGKLPVEVNCHPQAIKFLTY